MLMRGGLPDGFCSPFCGKQRPPFLIQPLHARLSAMETTLGVGPRSDGAHAEPGGPLSCLLYTSDAADDTPC
eukprot:2136934-Pyramimonas_sp.AAC.1